MAKRQVVILKTVDPADDEAGGMPSMGSVAEVADMLARYNTTTDGSKPKRGGEESGGGVLTLYGPGMLVEMAPQEDEVKQLMVTMTDEDFAFPVLTRACRAFKWTMMDPESGQRLRFA